MRDKLSQWLRKEAALAEAQAAIHGVGCELEGLLLDVQLLPPGQGCRFLHVVFGLQPGQRASEEGVKAGLWFTCAMSHLLEHKLASTVFQSSISSP